MWGNQGRWWLRPEAATEKLQVDGGNMVLTSSQHRQGGGGRSGRVRLQTVRSAVIEARRWSVGPPLAWPSTGSNRLTVITSAFVQFLPRSHKKPPGKEVNVFFFFLETPLTLESFSHFLISPIIFLSKACLHFVCAPKCLEIFHFHQHETMGTIVTHGPTVITAG